MVRGSAKANVTTVDDYIRAQPEAVRGVLTRVRGAIQRSVGRADESISYHMPTYKLNGEVMLYFAGWRQHYSLYPATPAVVAELEQELAPYQVEKGTIRFPLEQPVPIKLIAAIAKLRAKEVSEHVAAKAKRR
jgi:uncharacterized protein YdhG (YjbR/CyaY superfamily)